jgi:hypothetical protein
VERRTFGGKAVEVRGLCDGVAVRAKGVSGVLVGANEKNIGLPALAGLAMASRGG